MAVMAQDDGALTGGKDLEQAATQLRTRIDEEFRISERLDAKQRQAFALAAGFFAVVQTVTFGSFAQDHVHAGERVWLLAQVVLAAGALYAVAHRLRHGEELQEVDDVRPDLIVQWLEEADDDDPEYFMARLVRRLSSVAEDRIANNRIRTRNVDAVDSGARWVLIFSGVELLVAVIVRI